MKISDCVVKEENQKEKKNISILIPGCITIGYTVWGGEGTENIAPTFGEIYNYILTHCLTDAKRAWGDNYEKFYEEALSKVETTVKTETTGYKYLCNFRDEVFELIEDEEVLSLAEEEKKREEYREEYAVAKKKFRSQQWVRFITIALTGGLWFLMFLLDKNFATQIAPMPLLLIIITAFGMIGAKLRFEDGFWM